MSALDIIKGRIQEGRCPICAELISETFKTYMHPVFGAVKICITHPTPED